MKKLVVSLFLLSACTVTEPAGYLLGAPVAVTTTNEPAVRVKLPGFEETPPSSSALDPFAKLTDATVGIFAGTGVSASPGNPAIQAMSLGYEILVATVGAHEVELEEGDRPFVDNYTAALEVGWHGWTAIGFSINGTDLGGHAPAPSIEQALANGTANRTIFNYFLPGSHVEGLEIEEESVPAMDPEELGLPDPTDSVQGVDMHMALLHTDLGEYALVFTRRPLPAPPYDDIWCYFTLRQDFLDSGAADGLANRWHAGSPASSTIYMTHWDGTKWSVPIFYRTWDQLNFARGSVPVPIDGLSIDAKQPGALGNEDKIMFSLAGSHSFADGPENQLLFVSTGATTDPPRRVVFKRGSRYRYLGRQLGAGTAIGDTCVGDPWFNLQFVPEPPEPDDFLIARRLAHMPDTGMPEDCGESKLALASAGYRMVVGPPGSRIALLRTCMSWPEHCEHARGTATVHIGLVHDFMQIPGPVGNIWWLGGMDLPYEGEPLQFDYPLPQGGMLAPGPLGANKTAAVVAVWQLHVDGVAYRSPIIALRY